MRIASLRNWKKRRPERCFMDLPLALRVKAYQWFNKFVQRWGGDLPYWRRAILMGQARRLALNPPTSAWGRSMLARRGGYAVQRKYRQEGKTGKLHPVLKAAAVSASRRNAEKRRLQEAEQRKQRAMWLIPGLGSTSRPKVKKGNAS